MDFNLIRSGKSDFWKSEQEEGIRVLRNYSGRT
jgi:hypothetical protein